ncbi:unnamed protein product, partial [Musa acuminata var. zebrina]
FQSSIHDRPQVNSSVKTYALGETDKATAATSICSFTKASGNQQQCAIIKGMLICCSLSTLSF